jgi:hypothetical protein
MTAPYYGRRGLLCLLSISSSQRLDGRIQGGDAVFEAKFMLPWSFTEEAAAEKYMPQLQHNMWVVAARTAVLSVITGGGKWVEIATHANDNIRIIRDCLRTVRHRLSYVQLNRR